MLFLTDVPNENPTKVNQCGSLMGSALGQIIAIARQTSAIATPGENNQPKTVHGPRNAVQPLSLSDVVDGWTLRAYFIFMQ